LLLTASLSFLGLGVKPPTPELGALVTQGREHLLGAWWYTTFPGFVIFLAVLASNLLGDSLRDALDPALGRE
jgi:peptide/nickel transport system permease protein